ncbi:MAG: type II toxin-antitoxin system MqsA family antitoxin [Bdellovibrio sp.]|nr:type II toxin-antitoxin system MqsA family antitoxin [Bdellovibrio sp.]
MKTKKTRGKSKVTKVLADNACPSCGLEMTETKGRLSFPVNGEEITVPNSSHLQCRKCDEVVLRLDESRNLRERALEIYREKYRLLSGDEVRRLRERLALTQIQLAELLRLGVNTISRWESGRNVQTAAMDILLRLVRDVPGSVEYLRSLAA